MNLKKSLTKAWLIVAAAFFILGIPAALYAAVTDTSIALFQIPFSITGLCGTIRLYKDVEQ